MRALLPALLIAVAMSGCARPGAETQASSTPTSSTRASSTQTSSTSGQPSESVEVTDSNGMRSGVLPSTRIEAPSDADRPDGPPPTPDSELTAADLERLITVPASAQPIADSCTAADVRLSLGGIDAAAGHRYAQLKATNTADRACSLVGWPGLGLRGGWGTALPIVAERSTMQVDRIGVPSADPATAVTLAAGGSAVAEFEWTGALAGNRDEHASLIAIQLTADSTPVGLPIEPAQHVDIGPETTVRVGWWGPTG